MSRKFIDYTEAELRELPKKEFERLLNEELTTIRNEAIERSPHVAAYHAAKRDDTATVTGSTVTGSTASEPIDSEVDTDDEPELEKAPEVYSHPDQKAILLELCKLPKHGLEYQLGNYPRESFTPEFISAVLPSLKANTEQITIIQKHFGLPTTPTAVTDHLPSLASRPTPKATTPSITAETVITGGADILRRKGIFSKNALSAAGLRRCTLGGINDPKRAARRRLHDGTTRRVVDDLASFSRR